MSTGTNQETGTESITGTGEGDSKSTTSDVVSLTKAEYEDLVGIKSSYGSLKRDFKDLKKSFDEKSQDTPPNKPTPDSSGLLEKGYLRMAGIQAQDEVDFALSKAKKWGMTVDQLVEDDDFQGQLAKLRTAKNNAVATSNIQGGAGTSQAKNDPAYWIAKGLPPTRDDVPDRKTRAKIARAMVGAASKKQMKFYNE